MQRHCSKKSFAIFTELGMRWDIAWVLMNLSRVAIASEDWQEAEILLRKSIKLSLTCHAMPQAIEGGLELAECFIQKSEFDTAMELILPSMHHPSSTDAGRQRAAALKSRVEKKSKASDLGRAPLETVLARLT